MPFISFLWLIKLASTSSTSWMEVVKVDIFVFQSLNIRQVSAVDFINMVFIILR